MQEEGTQPRTNVHSGEGGLQKSRSLVTFPRTSLNARGQPPLSLKGNPREPSRSPAPEAFHQQANGVSAAAVPNNPPVIVTEPPRYMLLKQVALGKVGHRKRRRHQKKTCSEDSAPNDFPSRICFPLSPWNILADELQFQAKGEPAGMEP